MIPLSDFSLFDRLSDAPDAISRIRRFVLDLAVRGKLVRQDSNDEPATELLKRIQLEKDTLPQVSRLKQGAVPPIDTGEVPFELPQTWEWMRVGWGFQYDAGTKREPRELLPDRWLLELEDIEKDTSLVQTRLKVQDRDSRSTKSEFKAGDILYGKLRPYLNKVVVADESGYSTTEIVAIRPLIPLNTSYCCLAFRRPDFVEYVSRVGQGTKMPRLRTQDALVALFPLPPLAEQHRIVAKVGELMAICDQLEIAQHDRENIRDMLAEASLHPLGNGPNPEALRKHARFYLGNFPRITARPDQIDQLRQTILKLAISGQLVSQDPNDEPAAELLRRLQAKKAQLIKQKKIKRSMSLQALDAAKEAATPAGWAAARLGSLGNASESSIVDGPFGSAINTARDYRDSGVPVTRMSNIAPFLYRKDNGKFVDPNKFLQLRRHNILPGDVLLGKVGSIGNAAIYPDDMPEGMIATTGVARFRVGEVVSSQYLCILLNALRPELLAIASQAVQPFLSMKTINNVVVTIPPLLEQHRIVAKVNELMRTCDQLEAQLTTVQTETGRLLEAVLHHALYDTEKAASTALIANGPGVSFTNMQN